MEIRSIIDAFGGIGAAAEALETPYTTVYAWYKNERAPKWRYPQIMQAAEEKGITLPSQQ